MKILILSNKAPYPPNDGSSIAIYNMVTGLVNVGADVTLLTINTKKHFKPDAEVPAQFVKECNYTSVYQDTDVNVGGIITNLFFSSDSYFVSRFYFEAFRLELKKLLAQNTYDIIQLEGIFMAVYLPLIKELSKAKVTVRTHNVEGVIWDRVIERERSFLKKIYLTIQNKRLKKFENKTLPIVDAIVSITQNDMDVFQKMGIKTKFIVSPTGINTANYLINNEKLEEKSVFHFGSMDWLPNEEAVLWFAQHVWPLVLNQVPNAKFYVVGRGISAVVKNLATESIKIIGEVKLAQDIYHEKQIMVVPLLSGSGMRIKLLEGMAYAKAIVATRVGAEGILVKNSKECLIADSPEDFAKAVINLINEKTLRDQLQDNARAFVEEHFNNKTLANKLNDFYTDLIH